MTPELTVYNLDDRESWQRYYEKLDEPGPYHSPEYIDQITGRLRAETTAELAVLEDDDEFVYYPYLIRPIDGISFLEDSGFSEYRDIVASWYYGGPILAGQDTPLADAFIDVFNQYCQETGIIAEFVRFDPNLDNHVSFSGLEPTFERETVPVDLDQTVEELWDGFEKRNRNAIRQAQDTAIVVEQSRSSEAIEGFHEIYTSAMEAKDATDHYRFPRQFFSGLLAEPDLASLNIARFEGEIIGGALVVHDDRIAHDYLRASNPDYWDMRVNNLLCYEALMHARERGCEVFDFQGGRPGVFKFKKAFSPDRGEFYIAKRIHMPEVYEELVGAATDAGVDTDTDYFPAYRVAKSN